MKKIAVFLLAIFCLVGVLGFITPTKVSAGAIEINGCDNSDANFFNFPRWCRGLNGKDNPGEIIAIVGLNILDMMVRIAGMVAVGYVIYGGFLYLTSNGSPDKAKQGLDAIIKSLVGMTLAASAAVLISFIIGKITN